jgi:hypothetical protein
MEAISLNEREWGEIGPERRKAIIAATDGGGLEHRPIWTEMLGWTHVFEAKTVAGHEVILPNYTLDREDAMRPFIKEPSDA